MICDQLRPQIYFLRDYSSKFSFFRLTIGPWQTCLFCSSSRANDPVVCLCAEKQTDEIAPVIPLIWFHFGSEEKDKMCFFYSLTNVFVFVILTYFQEVTRCGANFERNARLAFLAPPWVSLARALDSVSAVNHGIAINQHGSVEKSKLTFFAA